ncbi:MAG: hypothetical protein IPH06_13705 [Alphaproteobacteria bacterium]|nr:hypothetical protein [Alphaproteobacteria bacterium]
MLSASFWPLAMRAAVFALVGVRDPGVDPVGNDQRDIRHPGFPRIDCSLVHLETDPWRLEERRSARRRRNLCREQKRRLRKTVLAAPDRSACTRSLKTSTRQRANEAQRGEKRPQGRPSRIERGPGSLRHRAAD